MSVLFGEKQKVHFKVTFSSFDKVQERLFLFGGPESVLKKDCCDPSLRSRANECLNSGWIRHRILSEGQDSAHK